MFLEEIHPEEKQSAGVLREKKGALPSKSAAGICQQINPVSQDSGSAKGDEVPIFDIRIGKEYVRIHTELSCTREGVRMQMVMHRLKETASGRMAFPNLLRKRPEIPRAENGHFHIRIDFPDSSQGIPSDRQESPVEHLILPVKGTDRFQPGGRDVINLDIHAAEIAEFRENLLKGRDLQLRIDGDPVPAGEIELAQLPEQIVSGSALSV